MHMSYWFGTNVADLLFQGFTISTVSGFVCTCLGIISLAVLFDALKLAHLSTTQTVVKLGQMRNFRLSSETSLLPDIRTDSMLLTNIIISCREFILFITHEFISYILMLIVMTYNGYFTIATVLGAGIGYFIFSPALIEMSFQRNAHLHSRELCQKCIDNLNTHADISKGTNEEDAECSNTSPIENIEEPSTSEGNFHSQDVVMVHSGVDKTC